MASSEMPWLKLGQFPPIYSSFLSIPFCHSQYHAINRLCPKSFNVFQSLGRLKSTALTALVDRSDYHRGKISHLFSMSSKQVSGFRARTPGQLVPTEKRSHWNEHRFLYSAKSTPFFFKLKVPSAPKYSYTQN